MGTRKNLTRNLNIKEERIRLDNIEAIKVRLQSINRMQYPGTNYIFPANSNFDLMFIRIIYKFHQYSNYLYRKQLESFKLKKTHEKHINSTDTSSRS